MYSNRTRSNRPTAHTASDRLRMSASIAPKPANNAIVGIATRWLFLAAWGVTVYNVAAMVLA